MGFKFELLKLWIRDLDGWARESGQCPVSCVSSRWMQWSAWCLMPSLLAAGQRRTGGRDPEDPPGARQPEPWPSLARGIGESPQHRWVKVKVIEPICVKVIGHSVTLGKPVHRAMLGRKKGCGLKNKLKMNPCRRIFYRDLFRYWCIKRICVSCFKWVVYDCGIGGSWGSAYTKNAPWLCLL